MSFDDFSEDYLNTILDDGLTIREHMEQGYKNSKNCYEKLSNQKFNRTLDEQEQSFKFLQKYKKVISKIESKIYLSKNNTLKSNSNNKLSIIIAILQCNKSIFYYSKLKKFCYQNGGQIYFQDMWEYCHNSQNDCFEYITEIQNLKIQLINLLNNYNTNDKN